MTKDTAMPDGTLRKLGKQWREDARLCEQSATCASDQVSRAEDREAASIYRECADELDAALRVPEGQQAPPHRINRVVEAVLHQMTDGEASDFIDADDEPGAADGTQAAEDNEARRDLRWCRRQLANALRESNRIAEARVPEGGPVEPQPPVCNRCDQPIMHELVCEDCLPDCGFVREGGSVLPASPPWQELYNATTVLLAALTFTHCTEDLVKPELNQAIERAIYARGVLRRAGLVTHTDAALIPEAPGASQAGEK